MKAAPRVRLRRASRREVLKLNGSLKAQLARRFCGAGQEPILPEVCAPNGAARAVAGLPAFYFLFLPKLILPKRELNRDRRPPRATKCCEPPVQAGWVVGSMSRWSVPPSVP